MSGQVREERMSAIRSLISRLRLRSRGLIGLPRRVVKNRISRLEDRLERLSSSRGRFRRDVEEGTTAAPKDRLIARQITFVRRRIQRLTQRLSNAGATFRDTIKRGLDRQRALLKRLLGAAKQDE